MCTVYAYWSKRKVEEKEKQFAQAKLKNEFHNTWNEGILNTPNPIYCSIFPNNSLHFCVNCLYTFTHMHSARIVVALFTRNLIVAVTSFRNRAAFIGFYQCVYSAKQCKMNFNRNFRTAKLRKCDQFNAVIHSFSISFSNFFNKFGSVLIAFRNLIFSLFDFFSSFRDRFFFSCVFYCFFSYILFRFFLFVAIYD